MWFLIFDINKIGWEYSSENANIDNTSNEAKMRSVVMLNHIEL